MSIEFQSSENSSLCSEYADTTVVLITTLYCHVPLLSPRSRPRVLYYPVFILIVSHQKHCVVDRHFTRAALKHSWFVISPIGRVYCHWNRPQLKLVPDRSAFSICSDGDLFDFELSSVMQACAGLANVGVSCFSCDPVVQRVFKGIDRPPSVTALWAKYLRAAYKLLLREIKLNSVLYQIRRF